MEKNMLRTLDLTSFKVLVIGAGFMAEQYCRAFKALKITDVSIVGNRKERVDHLSSQYEIQNVFTGGYERNLNQLGTFDLVVIATPIQHLLPALEMAVESGNHVVLLEKPGALDSASLLKASHKYSGPEYHIRVAFDRILFPHVLFCRDLAAEEGGFVSCHYTFTEWIHRIDFSKYTQTILERWGIANSIHVLSMAHSMIGLPAVCNSFQSGYLDWHPAGSCFAGSGRTENDVLFTYSADWTSAGRWGIEVTTKKHAYRFIPLEELWRCKIGSVAWEKIDVEPPFAGVKMGIAEEVAAMVSPDASERFPMLDLEAASRYCAMAEKVFGYTKEDG